MQTPSTGPEEHNESLKYLTRSKVLDDYRDVQSSKFA